MGRGAPSVGHAPVPRLGLLAWLAGLAPLPFILLVEGLFLLGMALPFGVAPMPLGGLVPPPKGFDLGLALVSFLNNSLIALLLRGLPLVELLLPPPWRLGWTPRLYLLLSAPLTGVLASPHGLPQGALYLALVLPLGLGEYAALALAALGRPWRAFLLLLGLALYEGWMVGLV